jgi:hypothetical protein
MQLRLKAENSIKVVVPEIQLRLVIAYGMVAVSVVWLAIWAGFNVAK